MIHPAIQHLARNAELVPHQPAFISEAMELSFSELWQLVRSISITLREAGVQSGQHVQTRIDSALGWPLLLALCHEATVAGRLPIRAQPQQGELDWIIKDKPTQGKEPAKIIMLSEDINDLKARDENIEPLHYNSEDDLAWVSYTSGTTGTPKAVGFTLRNLIQPPHLASFEPESDSPILKFSGLASSGGFKQGITSLSSGMPTFALAPQSSKVRDVIKRFGIEILSGSPVQFASLRQEWLKTDQEKIPEVRVVRCGGSLTPRQLVSDIRDVFPHAIIASNFASTEIGVISRTVVNVDSNPVNVGKPLPHVELQVVDQHGASKKVNEIGLLRFRAENMPSGYMYAAGKNETAFREGWFYSGDLGSINEKGELFLAGRQNDVVSLGGEKISLTLIDQAALEIEGVIDAASFILEQETGLPVLCIAYQSDPNFAVNTLTATLTKTFGFESPKLALKVQQLPRNEMGKIMRAVLAKQAAQYLSNQKAN